MFHATKSDTAASNLERDAVKAAEQIRASLGLWTSPKLGTVDMIQEDRTPVSTTTTYTHNNHNYNHTSSSSFRKKSERYHDISINDRNAWENDYDDEDEEDEFMDAALLHTPENDSHTNRTHDVVDNNSNNNNNNNNNNNITTMIHHHHQSPKRSKISHRSNTPVMSNNSKKKRNIRNSLTVMNDRRNRIDSIDDMEDEEEEEVEVDDDEVPYNIHSPWVKSTTRSTSSSTSSKKQYHPCNTPAVDTAKDTNSTLTASTTTTTTTKSKYRTTTTTGTTTTTKTNPNDMMVINPNHFGSSFQPYYIATERLWRFYNKPSLQDHNDVSSSSQQQIIPTNSDMWIDTTAIVTVPTTVQEYDATYQEEMKQQLDFILTLHRFCWSTSRSTHNSSNSGNGSVAMDTKYIEGNFWLLLSRLRQVGMATLLWENDTASLQQYYRSIQSHIQSVAVQINLTPAAILKSFYNTKPNAPITFMAPLPIQRRKLLLEWLHQCFQNQLPTDILRPRRTTKVLEKQVIHSKMYHCGLYRTDKDEEILSSCLSLLLAGRFYPDALDLVRNSHVHWRAAVWGGGIPHGYTTTTSTTLNSSTELDRTVLMNHDNDIVVPKLKSVGNPGRALWRRMMWKHSEQLAHANNSYTSSNSMRDTQQFRDAEVAIAALLSSNMKLALDCTPLRTWEGGLYCVMRCMMDRMEDDLFHRHNNYRRSIQDPIQDGDDDGSGGGPLYPGTEYETSEREHLQETYEIATIDEGEAVRILDSTPFEEMRGDDMVHQATASFIIGKSAIASFLQESVENISQLTNDELRFVTHVAFYLDAFSYSKTTPVTLPNVKQWKNELVLHYLSFLSCQDDLWYMIVLYASFLPVNMILDHLPQLLEKMESMEERKVVVQQLREFLPQRNLDLEVLRRVVDLVISESEEIDGNNDEVDHVKDRSLIEPSALDIRKMESVLWLSIQSDHTGEALIAANRLLRKFFLEGHKKVSSAILFVDEVLNEFLLNFVGNADVSMENQQDPNIENARLEHFAYLSFLEATKSVQQWKDVVRATHHALSGNSFDIEGIDKSILNVTELAIAKNAERRKIIDIKRTTTQNIVSAAQAACSDLRKIMEHPGGWLSTADEKLPPNDVDAILRRKELDQLHCDLLPHVVFMYHDVCVGTAQWMSKSLDDTADALNISAKDAVREIDETLTEHIVSSPVAPRYWTQKALELAEMTVKETYNVKSAFRTAEYKLLLSHLAETAATDCMYRYAE